MTGKNVSSLIPDEVILSKILLIGGQKVKVVANCDHLQKLKFSPYLPNVFTEHGVIMLASILNKKYPARIKR